MEIKNKEILIIEDSKSLLSTMLKGLNQFDYIKCRVDGAENGKEGLKKSKNILYDLIITDLQMPEKTGPEFIRELRKIDSHKKTPIILMSGYFNITPMSKYEDIIREDNLLFLDKPFNLRKVRNAIKYIFYGSLLLSDT